MDDLKNWVEEQIEDAVRCFEADVDIRTSWRTPLVAYASAHDPIFRELKTVISPSHLTPRELLPGAETVIVYFVPFAERIARSNRPGAGASHSWAVAYVETNRLLEAINQRVARALELVGYGATVLPPTHNFDEQRLISDWSHKHVAYVAGLGTFGLHHMLITEQGCCGRLGSLVTNARITSTPRKSTEACLAKTDGSCKVCVERCPAGALSTEEFDRRACYGVCLDNAARFEDVGLADVCGKCVSMVPCSFIDPVARTAAMLAPTPAAYAAGLAN